MKNARRRVGQPWAPVYSDRPLDWKEERKGVGRFLRSTGSSLAGIAYILVIALGLVAAIRIGLGG